MSESDALNEVNAALADRRANKARIAKAGVAFGIGSAAVVAALLYANRGKRAGPKE